MSTTSLIGLERALLHTTNVTTSDHRLVNALIGACSDAIVAYCRRDFHVRLYDELYDGTDADRLVLRNYPLQSIESVRFGPQVVLELINSSTQLNQQARVSVLETGLELLRVASGTLVRDTSVTWASATTLQAVATAISALGNGWNARVIGSATGDYGLWPSQDLWVAPVFGDAMHNQGALDCRGRWAGLLLHVGELSGYCWDSRAWLYRRDPWGEYRFGSLMWSGPPGYWRVRYSAGYKEVPESVQQACAEWVAELYHLAKRDPAVATMTVVGTMAETFRHTEGMPPRVQTYLAPYRRIPL